MKRNHTQILSLTLVAALIGSLLAVPTATEAATKKLKVTAPKAVVVNKSVKIKTNMKCNFKSSNKKIATVSSKGVVKGKKAGKVKITVTAKKNKQKKTVKITVKKQAKKVVIKTPSTSEPETTPTVIATQLPQGGVPQIPNPPTLMPNRTATPSTSTTPPAIPSPDVPSTQKPSASPGTTSTATPSTSTTPPAIPSPDVPSTQKPSASPMPTSTATPSPIKQPIGITAEFKGKVPMDKATGDTYPSIFNVSKWSDIIVKLAYTDNTERILKATEFSMPFGEVIEKDGKQFVERVITYENFSTTLQVEIVAVDSDVIYPYNMQIKYIGDALKKGEDIDINDLEVNVQYTDKTSKIIDANQITVEWLTDNGDENVYTGVYNYYFEYNGELLHICMVQDIYVPYE